MVFLIHFLLLSSDLGCHVDGFIAVAAHTFVIGASAVRLIQLYLSFFMLFICMYRFIFKQNKVTGRKADVILAAYNAAEAALRLLKPGSNVNLIF